MSDPRTSDRDGPDRTAHADPGSVILIVDDDPDILTALKIGFRRPALALAVGALECGCARAGLAVAVRASGRDALAILETTKVVLLLCDLTMPEMSGLE